MPTLTGALAGGATLVAIVFALVTLERWLQRRRLHDACWTISLVLFAAAAAVFWYGTSRGWSDMSFRWFYLLGGALNVPWLALGTVVLVAPRQWSTRAVRWLGLVSAWATGVITTSPLREAVPAAGLPKGKVVFGVLPRVIVAVGSGVAASVIVGLAVWSIMRVRGGRRRAAGNSLIAVGTAVLSASGALAAGVGELRAFSITLAAGVVALFLGFVVASGSAPVIISPKDAAQDLAVRALW